MTLPYTERSVTRFYNKPDSYLTQKQDNVAIEAPLQISLRSVGDKQAQNISMTMRTPGHDVELAAGFLFSEGIITHREQIIEHFSADNHVIFTMHSAEKIEKQLVRHFVANSSCGVCGKSSMSDLKVKSQYRIDDTIKFKASVICGLSQKLRQAQQTFDATGGLHAAGLFTAQGDLVDVREDVGRHNAVDKLIGAQMLVAQLPLAKNILMLSGRASFELLQKAGLAGIPIVVAIGAPSSLAIDTAQHFGITLIGFVREEHCNIYNKPERFMLSRIRD